MYRGGMTALLLGLLIIAPLRVRGDDPSVKPPVFEPPAFQLELKPDGMFTLHYRQVPLVTAEYHFWEGNWKWTEATGKAGALHDGAVPIELHVPRLGTQAEGTLKSPKPNVLEYDLTLKKALPRRDVIGGGIEFRLDLKSPLFEGRAAPMPKLLADNTGWEWNLDKGQSVRVVFTPAIAKVYFENNNPGRIRAFFISEKVETGTEPLKVTVTFPEGTGHKLSEEEEYGPLDTRYWIRDAFPYPNSPVDLSTLNHKPGTHGFLRAVGDHLEFDDGTPARFWGINVMAYALFSSNDQIARHAKRLAMLGFNLVRLHHHDTTAWVNPTVIDKHARSSRLLDPKGIDRIDYWIKCLRDNGIYVWLDLHSYRQFRDGDRSTEWGQVPTYEEFVHQKGQPAQVKGFCQYDPVVQKLMMEFQEKYLSHYNRYTGLAYKDDPAVAFVLLTNENDITCHYGVRAMPRTGNNELHRLFAERTHLFAEKTGLDENALQHPWNPGPAQIFLNDQEYAFYTTLTEGLRRIGSHALVADGNMWGGNSISSVTSLSAGDVIDAHEYAGPGLLTSDPRYRPNLISMIGINQVAAKPLTISEWNMVEYDELSVDRFAAPLYVASIAALQGWDAPILYGYSQQGLVSRLPVTSVWDSINDPGLLATMPAAAIAYRNGHVSPAKKTVLLALSRDQFFSTTIRPETCAAARTLIEQNRFALALPSVAELPWLKASVPSPGDQVINDPNQSFLAREARRVQSDTGEITRDWIAGRQTIDTPKSQVAQGTLDGREIRLSNVSMRIETRHATVAVTAMDEKPISSSQQILVTTVARVYKPKRVGRQPPNPSVYSEPVQGQLTIEAPAGLEATILLSTGETRPLPDATYAGGKYTLPLTNRASHWYLLRPEAAAGAR